MNNLKKYSLFLLLAVWSQLASGYIHNQTKSGIPVHWGSLVSVVDLYVNSQNSKGVAEATVQSIANDSINEWNGNSKITLRKNVTQTTAQAGFNEVYFSNDANVFNGSGVIGVTQVSFSETNGEILEADILINDGFSFSIFPAEQSYLGNVITHEVGHFLGLGHGQVAGSTMFYSLSRGQYKLADDDKAGIYSVYPTNDSTKGFISGTIVGGKNLISIFGTHVQAISVKTGNVMGASISELDGKFKILGLPRDDQYFIYTTPIKQLGIPTNYSGVKSDYCESSKSYRGSFFQSCGSSAEGFPQAISLSAPYVDVGNITIRCGLDNPPAYLQKKSVTPAEFDINAYTNSGLGGTFTGFFSKAEIQNGTAHDYFRVNLSSVDWNAVSTATNLALEIKIINQTLYSPFKAQVNINGVDVGSNYISETDGRYNLDSVMRLPITKGTPSANNFEIKITPKKIDDLLTQLNGGATLFQKDDFFPASASLEDNLYFYLVIATVVKDNGDTTYTQVSSKSDVISDNTQCTDAPNTYALTNYTASGTSGTSSRKKSAGCGTVDDAANGSSGGPGGFMVGLILSFIVSYALSRYSKMA